MDEVRTLIQKRLFWLGLLLLVGGVLLFFFGPKPSSFVIPEREDIRSQSISSAVITPEKGSWQKETFIVEIRDSALRGELASFVPEVNGCEYIIQDLGTKAAVGGLRECGTSFIRVTVGEGGVCSSSYDAEDVSQGKCRVSTRAFNVDGENSGWKGRTFQVDTLSPAVDVVTSLSDVILPNIAYQISATVSDNNHIIACQLFVNGEDVAPVEIQPIPCGNDSECSLTTTYGFEDPGVYNIQFGCLDTAGNNGHGGVFLTTVFVNSPPTIASCRVAPTQGDTSGIFQFSVEALDSDNDELSYLWNFGDGSTSIQSSPSHTYSQSGTYTPKVSVEDTADESVSCSTAWVVVEGE